MVTQVTHLTTAWMREHLAEPDCLSKCICRATCHLVHIVCFLSRNLPWVKAKLWLTPNVVSGNERVQCLLVVVISCGHLHLSCIFVLYDYVKRSVIPCPCRSTAWRYVHCRQTGHSLSAVINSLMLNRESSNVALKTLVKQKDRILFPQKQQKTTKVTTRRDNITSPQIALNVAAGNERV